MIFSNHGRLAGMPAYILAAVATLATVGLRLAIGFTPGDAPALSLLLLPIILGAYLGGLGPGLVATLLAALLADYLLLAPTASFAISLQLHLIQWAGLILSGVLVSVLSEALHRARRQAEASRQLQAVTLASVGDAVIATDLAGRITFLNTEAERLTGWPMGDAVGRPLAEVFRIIGEQDRRPVENPAAKALRTGLTVGLADHTLLVARDGRELPIDDSSAPIRGPGERILGVVLIFRDVTDRRRAEAELRQRELTLKLFVEHAPAAIAMLDRSLRYIAASRRFLHDYHLADAPVIGRSHYELFPDIPERWREIHRRCLAGAIERAEADPFPRADGTLDWVRWEIRPWFDQANAIGGIILFSEVITERVRAAEALREREARFHATLDSMLEGCQIIGFDWRYRYLNASVLRHSRTTREALIGRTMLEAFPGIETTPLFEVLRRCMDARIPQQIENEFRYADGSAAWFDLSIQPSPEGIFVLSIDITERKRAEQALESERASLAERVAERTADLRVANSELARAARLKDDFLANMSHELRTPLNAILGLTEILLEQIYGPLTPKQIVEVRGIEESGRHLLALINDILDLSKIEAGKIDLDPVLVEVDQICRIGLQMVAAAARSKRIGLTLSVDIDVVTIQADELRLKQILVNLLSNAVKFTPEGGAVGIEVYGDRAAQTATFTVWDTGIGIAEADMPQLFQPFTQIDGGLSRQYTGTGLGLTLVRRLAEAQGGTVAVVSAPGQGSRFSVALPWMSPPQPGAGAGQGAVGALEPELGAAADIQRPQILLAEDNEANIEVVRDYLSAMGYAVVVTRDGAEAVARAQELCPALILIDIHMPVLDGVAAIRRIRAAGLRQTPIIALTALAMPGDRERCFAAGANEYLTKPVSLRNLAATITAMLGAAATRA